MKKLFFTLVFLVVMGMMLLPVAAADPTVEPATATARSRAPAWVELNPPLRPSPRSDIAMAYDTARGVGVLFGGYIDGQALSETWEWHSDSMTWIMKETEHVPPARYGHVMVFDEARGATLMFGGSESGLVEYNDLWSYSGADWVEIPTTEAPSSRWLAAAAFDPDREVMVLFGGEDDGVQQRDTWELSGTTWSEQSIAHPTFRAGAMMAYDSQRQVMVLFGGGNLFGNFRDVWERVGSGDWQRIPTSPKPPSRDRGSGVYVPPLGQVMFFGGVGDSYFNDVLLWGGTRWRTRPFDPAPEPRATQAMVFDPVLNGVLVFGGAVYGNASNDLWLLR